MLAHRSVGRDALSVFFVYGFVDLKDLQSFPTRRSSDLNGQDLRRRKNGRRAPASAMIHYSSVAASSSRGRRGPRSPRDRKSTRLNSSHSQISYAAFCLKKKKNPPWEGASHMPTVSVASS